MLLTDTWERPTLAPYKALLDRKARRAPEVIQAHKVLQALLVLKVHRVMLGQLARQVLKAPRVRSARLGHKAQLEQQVHKVLQAQLVRKVHKAILGRQARKALLDQSQLGQ